MFKEIDRDPEFFKKVIFGDECYLKVQKCGNTYVRAPRGYKYALRYVNQKKKFNGGL